MSRLELVDRPAWLLDSAWPWSVQSVPTPAGRVAVTEAGHGHTLLLVHTGTWSFRLARSHP
jgi:haloalkane dehalogenase